jgi:hypothetical protein
MNELLASCPQLGVLRQALDDDAAVDDATRQHVAGCPRCLARTMELRSIAAASAVALGRLPAATEIDAQAAYRRFSERVRGEPIGVAETGWSGGTMTRFWSSRAARSLTAVAAALILMTVVAVSPARGLADTVLDRFRVQKFAAVTIPMDMVQQVQAGAQNMSDADKQALQDELGKLGSFNTTLNMQSAHKVASVDDARAAYGSLDVPSKLPSGFDAAPQAYVSDAGTASVTVNVAEAQALIKRMGLPIYSLPDPAQYPTLTFTAELPKAAVLDYQNADGKHLIVGQMESPTLDIPQGIDMNALREDILQLPGLPADLVGQLRQIKDWQHTLVIPVPSGATSHDVTINGQPALLIEGNTGEGSAVLWQKDGFLYVVAGQVSSDAVQATADAMQ